MSVSERVGVFDVVHRLRTALGHLEAVTRMVESDRSCADVLHQLSAVQGALDVVRRDLLERYLRDCLEASVAAGGVDDLVDELLTATYGGPVRTRRPPRGLS
ncbi:MAG: metal-sensitive transcriptional regulator [Acidobacteria bacterium]|nr:metal-sensitive transcriptional regulator [Acidobacteriota bacterium]